MRHIAKLSLSCFSMLVISSYGTSTAANTPHSESVPEFCLSLPRPEYAELTRRASPDPWFELYEVAEGVTAIYEPQQWQEVISYLIEGSDRALLFDTGNGIGNIATVVASLSDKPITVLNSHGHYDHVGGNHAFATAPHQILGMNTAFTRARQAGVSNANIRIEVSSEALCSKPPQGVSEDTHVGQPYSINAWIDDGHKLDLGDRTLEVIHIPGHTPDAIALFDSAAGLLWTGDTFYAGPIWLFAPETNLDDYRKSLQRLIDLTTTEPVKWLLPAHNTPLVKPTVLPIVLGAFDDMISGKLTATPEWSGTVSYAPLRESVFSFLMRDEPLPYAGVKE